MQLRPLLGLLAPILLLACSGNPADKSTMAARAALSAPAAVALAAHADADHALAAGGLQDLDKTAERFMAALETLPEPTRTETQGVVSRPKLLEWFGFDPTKRAGWDDVGVDAAAGVFLVLDDRWPRTDGSAPQVVVFVRLSNPELWKALLTRKGAVFAKEPLPGQADGIETCEINKSTYWLARSGADYAMALGVTSEVPEVKAAAMKAFLAIAQKPAAPLDQAASWKTAVRDAGRPWLAAWARTGDLYKSNPDFSGDVVHFTKLFPQLAWWLGEGWALRVMTTPLAHQSLKDMFVPDKLAPACAGLIPAEGWGALRLSIHLNTFADGLLRLVPPSTSAEERAVMAASVTSALAMTGLPPGDVMAAWNGHTCAAIDMSSIPPMLSGDGLPNWLLVLGVQDGVKADAALAALVDRAKNQMSATVRTATIGGLQGYAVQLGPVNVAVVRDGERMVFAPSPEALTAALARPVGQSLASTPMADALDGRSMFGVIVDLKTARDILLSVLQARQMADDNAKSITDTFNAVLGGARLAGIALRLDDGSVALGPAGPTEAGWSGATMIGILAAVAIPQFQKYVVLAKVAEARANLKTIRQAAVLFWTTERLDGKSGKNAAPRFPQTTVVTPGVSCCDPAVDRDGDQRCDADPTPWQQIGWQELGFQPEGQHSFRYRFESSGVGDNASFVASAYGDLDCDGVQSTFQIIGKPCKGKNCKDTFKFDEKEVAPNE
jgi:hypothetical protein